MLTGEAVIASQAGVRRSYRLGFWGAIVVAATPWLSLSLSGWSTINGYWANQFGGRGMMLVMELIELLSLLLSLLQALAFVVVIASLRSYAPPERKAWLKAGLVLAVIFALMLGISDLGLLIARSIPGFYERLLASLPAGNVYNPSIIAVILEYALMGLALLFALPAFSRGGLERATRELLGLIGVLLAGCGIGLLARMGTQSLQWWYFASLITRTVFLSAAMVMVAVLFRRAEKM